MYIVYISFYVIWTDMSENKLFVIVIVIVINCRGRDPRSTLEWRQTVYILYIYGAMGNCYYQKLSSTTLHRLCYIVYGVVGNSFIIR